MTDGARRTLFLPSCRPGMMRAFLDSLTHLPGWDVLVAFQEYAPADLDLLKQSPNYHRITDSISYPERRPPYPVRAEMYRRWRDRYDVWCSMDDDMELTADVDYEPMVRRVLRPDVGVVSGNWIRHEAWKARVRPVPEFVQQPLTNMAGGQMFATKVVDVLLASPVKDFYFCDIQVPLYAYLRGFVNFRYRGSVIIHRIMQRDGLQRTFKERTMDPPDPRFVTLRPSTQKRAGTGNNYHMPEARDVTRVAHATHRQERLARGWPV